MKGWLIAAAVVIVLGVLAETYYHQRTGITFLPEQDAKANAARDIQAELDLALRKQADQVVEDIRKNGLTQAAQTIEKELTPAQKAYVDAKLLLDKITQPPNSEPTPVSLPVATGTVPSSAPTPAPEPVKTAPVPEASTANSSAPSVPLPYDQTPPALPQPLPPPPPPSRIEQFTDKPPVWRAILTANQLFDTGLPVDRKTGVIIKAGAENYGVVYVTINDEERRFDFATENPAYINFDRVSHFIYPQTLKLRALTQLSTLPVLISFKPNGEQ